MQLITSTDVFNISDFNEVLSVSLNEIWGASINDVPSNGILNFREPFVLIGLTSAGESSTEGYVNHFSLSYAPSLNSSFQNLSNVSYKNYYNIEFQLVQSITSRLKADLLITCRSIIIATKII